MPPKRLKPVMPSEGLKKCQDSKRRAEVWIHFVTPADPAHEYHDQWMWCSHCRGAFTFDQKSSNTSNLTTHINGCHKAKSAIRKASINQSTTSTPTSTTSTASSSSPNESTNSVTGSAIGAAFKRQADKNVEPFSKAKAAECDRLIALVWASNCWAFNSAEDIALRQLIDALTDGRYRMPGRTRLTELIDEVNAEMTEVVAQKLENCPVSLTTDGGRLQNGLGFQAVVAHTIDENFKSREVTLSVCPTGASQTGDHVADILQRVLSKYRVEQKCVAACTDNCKSVVKAVRVCESIDQGLTCICHTMNLALQDVSKDKPVKAAASSDADNESVEDTTEVDPPTPNAFQLIAIKARRFVAKMSRSTVLAELFIRFQQSLIDNNESDLIQTYQLVSFIDTRFVAMCFVFERLLLLRDPINRFVRTADAQRSDLVGFTENEWSWMKEFQVTLRLFNKYSTKFEASKGAPLGFVGAELALLMHSLSKKSISMTHPETRKFCLDVRARLSTRVATMQNLKLYQIGFALDPRVCNKDVPGWNSAVCHQALKDAFSDFSVEKFTVKPMTPAAATSPDVSTIHRAPVVPQKRKRADAQDDESDDDSIDDLPVLVPAPAQLSEVDRYLLHQPIPSQDNPLEWWKARSGTS